MILHWLGEAFDPALRGYWGGSGFDAAAATVLELIDRAGGQVDGVKLSVLDAGREVALRRRLPAGVRLYTGDDFNYASLIRGDADGSHSDALLGAFAAITAPAAAALAALDRGDLAGYDAAMAPTVPLSRLIFEPPTYHYKAGVAFLAWLNGLQPQFVMLGGLERARSAGHLIRVFELAAAAGALTEPELAVERMGEMLARSAHAGSGVNGGIGLDRLSLNQATVKQLGLARGRRAVRAARHPGHRAVAGPGRGGRAGRGGGGGPRGRAAGLEPVPGRFLHGRRSRRAPGGAGGQPGRARGGGRAGHGHAGAGLRRAAARAAGPRPGPADDRGRDRLARACRVAGSACGSASRRCTRCSAPTGA